MNELFKGFIETKNKKSLEKYKNKTKFKTFEQVKDLDEFAGVLAGDIILVDVDDFEQSEILLNIVDDLQLRCRVYETSRGKHFLFKNSVQNTNKIHAKSAIGILIDTKIGSKNGTEVLKFNGEEREILYDKLDEEEYQECPKWLFPIKTDVDFQTLEAGDGRNQTLFNYILTLQSNDFSEDEAKECIKLINQYILIDPLDEKEIETITRKEAFSKPVFYKGQTFLFDKFAIYLKNTFHIIKINNQLHIFRDGIYVDGYKLIESEMIRLIPGLNRQKRSEVMSYLDILIDTNTERSDAKYIAFKNGVYDIEEDTFMDFNSNLIITNRIDFDYNPNAYSELVDRSLDKISCDDLEIRALLEEVIGYTFYRRNELRKAFILLGDKANGKSTYMDMINTLLGNENTCALDLSELGERFKTAELFGKLACIGDDIGDEFIANPAIFKKLVSGDRINAERKGCDPFDFNNYSKMLFSANNMPRIKDKSGAVLSRLVMIPFNAKFSVKDPDYDPYIKYKLRHSECMEYLIILGIEGIKRVLNNQRFTTGKKVKRELAEYEENNNPIVLFFKENPIDEILNQSTKDIYSRYDLFCSEGRFNAMSNIEFSKQVKTFYDVDIIDKTIKGKKYRVFVRKEMQYGND
jgi:putative DNA primase/helicase